MDWKYRHARKSTRKTITRRNKMLADTNYAEKIRKDARERARKRHNEKRSDPSYMLKKKKYSSEYERKDKENRKCKTLSTKVSFFSLISNGNVRCECCGIDDIDFLTLDHIQNDGAKEKKEISNGQGGQWLYAKIMKNKSKVSHERYRILCFNCNSARGAMGVCPHEMRRIMGLFDE